MPDDVVTAFEEGLDRGGAEHGPAFDAASDEHALREANARFVGPQGSITKLMKQMKQTHLILLVSMAQQSKATNILTALKEGGEEDAAAVGCLVGLSWVHQTLLLDVVSPKRGDDLLAYGEDVYEELHEAGYTLSEVASRWKEQFNENSKSWAFFESFPDLNHNAVAGYEFPREARDRIFVLMLRSLSFSSRSLHRYEATAELLTKAGLPYEFVEARGESTLAQVMGLVLLGDYSSF